MKVRSLMKSLVARVIVTIFALQFVVTGVPFDVYASIHAESNLRTRSVRDGGNSQIGIVYSQVIFF